MKESRFQKKVIGILTKQAAFIINMHGHLMQRPGIPDLFVVHRDWTGFLELKVGPGRFKKNRPSDIQKSVAKKINARRVPCYVLRCVDIDTEICDLYCNYNIETFDGKLIRKFPDLATLLEILIALEEQN